MKPPRSASPPDGAPSAGPEPAHAGALAEAEQWAKHLTARPQARDAARHADLRPLPRASGPSDQRERNRRDTAVRLSVIDGLDDLVYTDMQDREGWKQPLAVDEAVRDARRHGGVTEHLPLSESRVVRTLEAVAASKAADVQRSVAPTPYRAGMANTRGLPHHTSQLGVDGSIKPPSTLRSSPVPASSCSRRSAAAAGPDRRRVASRLHLIPIHCVRPCGDLIGIVLDSHHDHPAPFLALTCQLRGPGRAVPRRTVGWARSSRFRFWRNPQWRPREGMPERG